MLEKGTFDGRVAVVTGGGSGIGEAIAGELARLGATVALLGRTAEKLEAARAGIEELGGRASVHPLDIRDRAAVDDTIAAVVAAHGRVDHLVNNAAGNFRVAPEEMSPNAWRAVLGTVLDGTWHCTQAVGRHLIDRGAPGSILNIGSTMSMQGSPTTVHSASAKAGVLTMTKSLGAAWGPYGIRVNVLVPGITEGTAGVDILLSDEEFRAAEISRIPLRRTVSKTEVAAVATFLLSDHAGYVTGTSLVMDGGRSLGTH
ncbi:SDR family oxidoreductase [Pseudonocardia sp. RS11V-5]|uniref:SDR family oxidoreductase n=1 Tax=Pseudonocardia terrae TaxID=2905831 RepID=UPI001E45E513|nr:SDR family oxidoreductase [Pseudonocardia terrae]MCE3555921.1 SDR family oxidoreductase [Pseudonocardia terrae]